MFTGFFISTTSLNTSILPQKGCQKGYHPKRKRLPFFALKHNIGKGLPFLLQSPISNKEVTKSLVNLFTMSINNITILFWLFKAKKNKKGTAPIYLRISYQNERKNIGTGYLIEPERWDVSKNKVKGTQENAKQINEYITETKSRLMGIYNEMLKDGDISISRLIDKFLGKDTNQMTLLELIKFHNDDFNKRIGLDYTYSAFEKYDILRKKIELLQKDIRLRDLTHTFGVDFDFYLKLA